MIKSADFQAGTVTQVCDNCGREASVGIGGLEMGGSAGDVIAFPVCACGAFEAVFRTFASAFESSKPSVRHLAANLLAHRLKTLGKVAGGASVRVQAETELPCGVAELGYLDRFETAELARLVAEKKPA